MRQDGRSSTQLRPVKITPNVARFSDGSAIIEMGDTKVLCTVNVEESVPHFLRNSSPARGWLSAEYSMLPGSTQSRTRRERHFVNGRTQEIQRMIGRSLRGIMDFSLCPDMTFLIDCDVMQADGGTRTAAVTGAFVALKQAVDKLLRAGKLKASPIKESVAAVSVGFKEGALLVDLNYIEDSSSDLDMNVVMTSSGQMLELQGTAEHASFSKEQVIQVMDAGSEALHEVFELQKIAADGQIAES